MLRARIYKRAVPDAPSWYSVSSNWLPQPSGFGRRVSLFGLLRRPSIMRYFHLLVHLENTMTIQEIMKIANMSNADILVLWSKVSESRKQGSMTYRLDTAVIERCIGVLGGRGYFKKASFVGQGS
jgi:hypothetical protein